MVDGCPADYPDDDEWMSEEINATIRNIADCRSMMEWMAGTVPFNYPQFHISAYMRSAYPSTYVRTYLLNQGNYADDSFAIFLNYSGEYNYFNERALQKLMR